MCSGMVNSSRSTSGTRRVNLVNNPMASQEQGMLGLWSRQMEHIRNMQAIVNVNLQFSRWNVSRIYREQIYSLNI